MRKKGKKEFPKRRECNNIFSFATREIGLEVNADKTKYMVMSRDQNAGRIHSVRSDNSTFDRVEALLLTLPVLAGRLLKSDQRVLPPEFYRMSS